MTINKQFKTIKDNWLIVLVVLILIIFIGGLTPSFSTVKTYSGDNYAKDSAMMAERSFASMPGYYDSGFSPEIEERSITKSSSITTEVKNGKFNEAESRLKSIIKSSDSFLLNENVNKNGFDRNTYFTGYYLIKVEKSKYDSLINQIKDIGEITYLNENLDDITKSRVSLETDLEAEKARLETYKELLGKDITIQEKLDLTDRIFNQERTISYLEDALKNINNKVEYSTIQVTIQEKQASYANIAFTKFSNLVKSFVESLNALLYLVFIVIPWVIAIVIIWIIVRLVKKR